VGRKTYNQEFKDEAVALARTEGVGAGKAAAQLGVSVYTIRAWMKGQNMKPSEGAAVRPEVRVRQLEAEVRKLRLERDFLKKVSTHFASPEKSGSNS
jgi:transposase